MVNIYICIIYSVLEDTTLIDLLNKFVHPTKSDPIFRHRWVLYIFSSAVYEVDWRRSRSASDWQNAYHPLVSTATSIAAYQIAQHQKYSCSCMVT